MNIYKISRTDHVGYDEYIAFVVAAETTDRAFALCKWEAEGVELELQCIGCALEDKEQIILGSFNAG